jgi:hypothetical protein
LVTFDFPGFSTFFENDAYEFIVAKLSQGLNQLAILQTVVYIDAISNHLIGWGTGRQELEMTYQDQAIISSHDHQVLAYSYDQIRSLVLQASGIAEREDIMPLANLLSAVADAVAALRGCNTTLKAA